MIKLTMLLGGIAALGCRSDPATVDATNPGHLDAPSSTVDAPTTDGGTGCATYTPSSVAAMRQGTASGCFQLAGVITIGTTSSKKSPGVFVQDAAAGDFSAILTKCLSTSSTHPCTVATTVAAIPDGHAITVRGTYLKTKSTGFEEFLIDDVTDGAAAAVPASATATLAQVERNSTAVNLRFQHVTVTLGAADTLQMYDFTPSEFANTSATQCTYQFGFGMIPKSVTGVSPGAACSSGTAQPAGVASPNSAEVLIGTDFFKTYTISSDCRCAKTFSDQVPASTSTITGKVSGLLVFEVPFGGTTGYTYLDPKTTADAPLTGTVAGM